MPDVDFPAAARALVEKWIQSGGCDNDLRDAIATWGRTQYAEGVEAAVVVADNFAGEWAQANVTNTMGKRRSYDYHKAATAILHALRQLAARVRESK